MKLPTSFIPSEARIEKQTKNLLKNKPRLSPSPFNLESMTIGCGNFLASKDWSYELAEDTVKEINYTKYELQPFCEQLPYYEQDKWFHWIGFYLSALINKIIKKDEEIKIYLPNTNIRIDLIGSSFEIGKLIVFGNTGRWTGFKMKGGEVVINGDTEDFTGYGMAQGRITIKGKAKGYTGEKMVGGKISAKEIEEVSLHYKSGEIYEGIKKIRG